jgi:hypothetical protein
LKRDGEPDTSPGDGQQCAHHSTDKRAEPVRAALSVRQRIPLVEPSRSALLEAPNPSDRRQGRP